LVIITHLNVTAIIFLAAGSLVGAHGCVLVAAVLMLR